MLRKIIKVGSEAVITIPKNFLKEAKLRIGQEVAIESNGKLKTLLVKPKAEENKTMLTPEFNNWLDDFITKYQPILKELTNR